MWRPDEVVPEHRKRATALWGTLLLAIVGYTVWQVLDLRKKFNNPSTSLSVSDDIYSFPPVEICLWEGEGCDARLNASTCVDSVISSVFDSCGNVIEDLQSPAESENCVTFDLPKLSLEGFKRGCSNNEKPTATMTMDWYTSFDALNEGEYRESVGLYLGSGDNLEFMTVPYSRLVESQDGVSNGALFVEADMTISKMTRNILSGDTITTYPILTLATVDYIIQPYARTTSYDDDSSYEDTTRDTDDDSSYQDTTSGAAGNATHAIGYLYLNLNQGAYSATEIADINPIDIGTLLGNIGGFWELLLVTWGLCFIATARQSTPTHKGRDFSLPIQRGKAIVGRKRRSSTQAVNSDSDGGGDRQPGWSTAKRGRQETPGGNLPVIRPVGAQSPMDVSASSFSNPIPLDNPRRPASASGRTASVSGRKE